MTKASSLQDLFLNKARTEHMLLTVFLVNGFQIKGVCRAFDSFTVELESEGKQQIIYKHAISTIVPAKRLGLSDDVS